MVALSVGEKAFMEDGIKQGLRNDGRGREDFRALQIRTGVISQANGSSRLIMGGTQVLASVKAELGSPLEGRPSHGRIEVSIECSPTAAPEYEGRGGDELSSELARALERCYLAGTSGDDASIDLSALSLVDGKMCWVLYLDALVLSIDGSLLDALTIAFKAALVDLRLPKVNLIAGTDVEDEGDFEIVDDIEESTRLETSKLPIIVTLNKVGKYCMVDCTSEEEGLNGTAVAVAVTAKGGIRGVTKRDSSTIDSSAVLEMLSLAARIGKQLHRKVDAAITSAISSQEG